MVRRTFFAVWYLFAALVVTAAVGLSTARMLVPNLADYRQNLVDLGRERLEREVTLGGLDVAWRGFGPALTLESFQVLDTDGRTPVLSMEHLYLHVDLWASLWAGQLEIGGISASGVELELIRKADGQIYLKGLSGERRRDPAKIIEIFSRMSSFELTGSSLRWIDHTRKTTSLRLDNLNLTLQNDGDYHRVNLEASLPPEMGDQLLVAAEAVGPVMEPELWASEFYLELPNTRLDAWPEAWQALGVSLAGRAGLTLWGELNHGHLDSLALDWRLRDLQLARDTEAGPRGFAAEEMEGRLHWQRWGEGWRLAADRLQLVRGDRSWPEGALRLESGRTDAGLERWSGAVDYLDLADLSSLAQVLPGLDPGLQARLVTVAPRGRLQDLRFGLRRSEDGIDAASFELAFEELGNNAFEAVPGSDGWSGRLSGTLDHGELQLDSRKLKLDARKWFRDQHAVDQLSGSLNWQRYPDRLRLSSRRLRLENPDLALTARLNLDLPSGQESPLREPFIDLQAHVERADTSRTSRYLPAHKMSPKAVAWLDRGLVAGKVSGGGVIVHGPVKSFPFREQQGRFEVRLDVEDATLVFAPGWRAIEELNAEVAFIGPGMDIHGESGRIGDGRLGPVRAHVEAFGKTGPPLKVEGQVKGTVPGMLRYLEASPLGKRFEKAVTGFNTSGDADLALDLVIPIRKTHPKLTLQGDLKLKGRNTLNPKGSDLVLKQLAGNVRFTERSLDAEGVKGQLFGAPVDMSARTVDARRGREYQVLLDGRLAIPDLLGGAGQNPFLQRITGKSLWRAAVHIPAPGQKTPRPVRLYMTSDLKGTRVALPAPLRKASGDTRTVTVEHSFAESLSPWHVRLADTMEAVLVVQGREGPDQLVKGDVAIAGTPSLPEQNLFRVHGPVRQVSLDEWQPLLQPGSGVSTFPPMEIDLQIDTFQAFGRNAHQLEFQARQEADGWACGIAGPNAQGSVRLLTGKQGLQQVDLDFDRLRLETAAPVKEETDRSTDPASMPSLNVNVREVFLDEIPLGTVVLHSEPLPDGMQVKELRVESDDYRFNADGQWLQDANGRQVSRFQAELVGGDMGRILERFGYEHSVDTRDANGSMTVNWPGAPADFSLAAIQGDLSVNFGEGRIVQLEPGAGRALGLLSVQSLQRRLSLDFSDIFGEGFGFDSITGKFTFVDGDVYTDDMLIKGPSARIEVAGRTGVLHQDYDQLVTVTPNVSSNLPVAGALAGGPGVGAALLIADQLFGSQVDRLAQTQYRVAGSWEQPEIERIARKRSAVPADTDEE